jgi:hypothetical protein
MAKVSGQLRRERCHLWPSPRRVAVLVDEIAIKFGQVSSKLCIVHITIHQKSVANLICGNLGHQSQVQESESPPMLLSFDDKAV